MIRFHRAWLIAISFAAACGISGCGQTTNTGKAASTGSLRTSHSTGPKDTTGHSQTAPRTDEGTPTTTPVDTSRISEGAAVAFVNHLEGWVGGKGFIYHTADGGQHWNVQFAGDVEIHRFTFMNALEGWALASTESQGGTPSRDQTILHTVDGGNHWSVLARVPADDYDPEIHFVSGQVGFVGSEVTHDGGTTWQVIHVPKDAVGHPFFSDASHGWVMTSNSTGFQIERTSDEGGTWFTTLDKPSQSPVNGSVFSAISPNDAWAMVIGGSGMSQTSYSVFHTTNGGTTWNPLIAHATAGAGPAPGIPMDSKLAHGPGSKPGGLYVIDETRVLILGTCPACGEGTVSSSATVDSGNTWIDSTMQLPGQEGQLSFVDGVHGWLFTKTFSKPSVLYETSDAGKTWTTEFVFGPQSTTNHK